MNLAFLHLVYLVLELFSSERAYALASLVAVVSLT
jgi:hypothetical protein